MKYFYQDEFQRFSFLEDLHRLRKPLLMLVNDSSPIHARALSDETAKYIPKDLLEYHFFENCGAPIYADKPKECEVLVRAFLEKHK